MSGKPLLTIDARAPRRGDADFAVTRFDGAQPQLGAQLPLIAWSGDDFVERWMEFLSGTTDLEELLPFRDWSEPPQGMLDGAGAPSYDPAAIERGAELQPVAAFGAEDVATDADGVPTATPPWFRKLYQPAHGRFNIACAELVCRQPTLPAVSPRRIVESGVVVRRIALDAEGAPVHEDWIAGTEGRGMWRHVTAANGACLDGFGEPADPADVALPEPTRGAIRADLGLSATSPIAIATSSAVVAPPSGGRTRLWAYVPLTSSDVAVQPTLDRDPDAVRALIKSAVHEAWTQRLRGTAATLNAALSGNVRAFAEPLIVAAPSAASAAAAETALAAALVLFDPLSSEASRRFAVQAQVARMVGAYWVALWTGADSNLSSYAAWRNAARGDAFSAWDGATDGREMLLVTSRADFDTLFDAGLADRWSALEAALDADTAPTGSAQTLLQTVAALMLRRTRALRHDVVRDVYLALGALGAEAYDAFPTESARLGCGGVAAELDNWVLSEAERNRVQRPWPPIALLNPASGAWPAHAFELHERMREIERALEDLDDVLAEAGATFTEFRAARLVGAADVELGPLWQPADGGLDPAAQPELGLLAWPGPFVDEARLDDLIGAVAPPLGPVMTAIEAWPAERALAEHDRRAALVRPRFDTDHLYVAQLWARVAGPRPCDPAQVVWSQPTAPFRIAALQDLLGARPVAFETPNLPQLLDDLGRIARARANPFAHVATPNASGFQVGDEPADTRRSWDLAMVCSFGIPVFTICAWIVFQLIFNILIRLPGFVWMLLLKFCLPVPRRS